MRTRIGVARFHSIAFAREVHSQVLRAAPTDPNDTPRVPLLSPLARRRVVNQWPLETLGSCS